MDFLTRLAERALNVEPSVKPRPVPLFSPEQSAGIEEVEFETEAATAPSARRPEAPPLEDAPNRSMPADAGVSGAAVPPPGLAHTEPDSPALEPRPQAAPAAPAGTHHNRLAPSADRPARPVHIVAETAAPLPQSLPPPSRIETVTHVEHTVLQTVQTLRGPAPSPRPLPATARGAKRQPEPPATAPRDRPISIDVTIGRVEVRAVAPPPPPRPEPARRAPALTLDDYLESRNRGRS